MQLNLILKPVERRLMRQASLLRQLAVLTKSCLSGNVNSPHRAFSGTQHGSGACPALPHHQMSVNQLPFKNVLSLSTHDRCPLFLLKGKCVCHNEVAWLFRLRVCYFQDPDFHMQLSKNATSAYGYVFDASCTTCFVKVQSITFVPIC